MYYQKLAASVKCDGRIMREHGDTVYIPYGKEYSLLLKNLDSRKALVNVSIDGQDVVPNGLIVASNTTIDLERFLLNGNMNEGPKFKFIERTEQIAGHRGERVDDGIVRISYQFEAIPPQFYYHPPVWNYNVNPLNTVYRSQNVVGSVYSASVGASTTDATLSVSNVSDTGITAHGSKSDQSFTYGSIGALDAATHVIILQLKGDIGQHRVEAPVTVRRKVQCANCGTMAKSSAVFCSKCGTNLTYQY